MQTKDTTTPSSNEDNANADNYRIADTTVINNDLRYSAELKRRIQEQKALDKLLTSSGHCCICGIIDPLVLEEHHIAGRKHSDLTLTLCANCHQKLSRKQRSYPKAWLNARLSPLKCVAFTLRGIADILRALSEFLIEHEDGAEAKEENDGRGRL